MVTSIPLDAAIPGPHDFVNSYDNVRVTEARSGAIQGLLCMMAYWIVESYFLYILPWLREPGYQYTSMHTGFTAIVLAVYIGAGLLVGAVLGKWATSKDTSVL